MIVETHLFKEAFVQGDAAGFVVCADLPPTGGRPARRIFAKIYGCADCYHIFEDGAEAERHRALAAAGPPPREGLGVREVRVENIRDYQRLAGVKTVFLVDCAGQATQSLRVGFMPLPARTNAPFPGPLPIGLRTIRHEARPKGSVPPDSGAPAASPDSPLRMRRPLRLEIDWRTFDDEAGQGKNPPAHSPRPGLFARFFRRLRRWFR